MDIHEQGNTLSDQGKKELQRMYAELKKELKKYSKNDLIRMIGSTLIDLHVTREALSQALNKPEDKK